MSRQNILDELRNSLSDVSSVVFDPDLRLLMDGPDILIGENGNLLGIFVPRMDEVLDVSLFLTRFALSRLALPDHARFLLVIDSTNERRMSAFASDEVSDNFHEVLLSSSASKATNFLRDSEAGRKKVGAVSPEIRQYSRDRFALAFAASVQRFGQDSSKDNQISPNTIEEYFDSVESNRSEIRSWHRPPRRLPRSTASIGKRLLVAGVTFRGARVRPRLRPYLSAAVVFDYSLDSGVPYPVADLKSSPMNLMIVDQQPEMRLDPWKPVRAAAFAGWTLSLSASRDEIAEYSEAVETIEMPQVTEEDDDDDI